MFIRIIKSIVCRLGYMIIKLPEAYSKEHGYVLHRFSSENESFNYEKYKRIQKEGNKKKLHKVWTFEENIKFLAKYIQKK